MHETFLLILLYNITIREGQYLFYSIGDSVELSYRIKIAEGPYPSAILSIYYLYFPGSFTGRKRSAITVKLPIPALYRFSPGVR